MFTSVCAYVHCKSTCASICKNIFLFFCLNVRQFLHLWICSFICLFGCSLLVSLYLPNFFTVILSLILQNNLHFHQSSPIVFYFILSSAHLGRIQDIAFDRHVQPPPIHCMGKPFNLSTHYFVLFVFQKVTFCLF